MADEVWVEIPLDGITFIKLIEGDTILLDSLGGSQHPKCPECNPKSCGHPTGSVLKPVFAQSNGPSNKVARC